MRLVCIVVGFGVSVCLTACGPTRDHSVTMSVQAVTTQIDEIQSSGLVFGTLTDPERGTHLKEARERALLQAATNAIHRGRQTFSVLATRTHTLEERAYRARLPNMPPSGIPLKYIGDRGQQGIQRPAGCEGIQRRVQEETFTDRDKNQQIRSTGAFRDYLVMQVWYGAPSALEPQDGQQVVHLVASELIKKHGYKHLSEETVGALLATALTLEAP